MQTRQFHNLRARLRRATPGEAVMSADSTCDPADGPLLLDGALPEFGFSRLECMAVAAAPPLAYEAARGLDLLTGTAATPPTGPGPALLPRAVARCSTISSCSCAVVRWRQGTGLEVRAVAEQQGVALVEYAGCGRLRPWTPFGRCS
ncbi:hypothetical protein GCM10010440_71000 [Kitasatospora cinereorecta]